LQLLGNVWKLVLVDLQIVGLGSRQDYIDARHKIGTDLQDVYANIETVVADSTNRRQRRTWRNDYTHIGCPREQCIHIIEGMYKTDPAI
jgi:hypothetical protein